MKCHAHLVINLPASGLLKGIKKRETKRRKTKRKRKGKKKGKEKEGKKEKNERTWEKKEKKIKGAERENIDRKVINLRRGEPCKGNQGPKGRKLQGRQIVWGEGVRQHSLTLLESTKTDSLGPSVCDLLDTPLYIIIFLTPGNQHLPRPIIQYQYVHLQPYVPSTLIPK